MDTTQLLALAAALGWASGLRLYAVVFLTGLAGQLGWVELPPGLQLLQRPLLLGASGLMLAVEFFADKIPGLDSLWDAVQTFIRIPAGALLAAAVFGGDQASWALIAALMGGTLAATSHAAKAGTRAAANTSPEPFSNLGLSLLDDAAVQTLLLLSADEVVPGPYTYRRFWFRDACIMMNSLLAIGMPDRCRRMIEKFPARQLRNGYFRSQEGEWDSNGEAIWTYHRFATLTGETLREACSLATLDGEGICRVTLNNASQQIGLATARIDTTCDDDGEVWRVVIPGAGHEWYPATYDLMVQFLTTGPFRTT